MATTKKKLQFSAWIDAPVERVWRTMTEAESYRDWTSAFAEGSYYEGSWDEGATIRFLSPSGNGMIATIEEYRLHEYISIKHLGFIANGVADTKSDQVRSWAPAFENYTFRPVRGGTELVVDQDVTEDFEQMMLDSWPKALQRLKDLSERRHS